MDSEDKLLIKKRKMMFYEAIRYLLEKGRDNGITPKAIKIHLKDREGRKPKNIDGKGGLFYKMLQHAINRNGNLMKNVIGDFDNLSVTLFNFDPKRVYQKYGSNEESWKNLLNDLVTNLNLKDKNRGNRDTWVIFSKSIISIAEFLSTFNTIDDFNNYVDSFSKNEDKMIELANILEKRIYGFGFALACDFLKENCSSNYVKPDRHIMRLFTNEYVVDKLSLSIKPKTKRLDIKTFRAVMEYSSSIHKQPYKIDKLFYLVGSSDFYLVNKNSGTSMDEFINRIKKKFDSMFLE